MSEALPRQGPDAGALEGRTCVVTGASRGIGRAIALELARNGATVAVNYRSSEGAASDVCEEIAAEGSEGTVVRADVANPDAVERMSERVHDEFGSADVVVNNAGITADTKIENMSAEEWERVITTDLTGVFNCTRAFYEDVRSADDGRFVNVSSVVGRRGNVGQANYAAAKSGLFGFTRSLARELAPHRSTANCVAPGYTETDMIDGVREDVKDRIRAQIPLRRFASVQEIAKVVRFLASDDASYVTGEVVNVNGGLHM